MKPISLEFTAFGSYPGTETIDFTSLAELGLYIVTGPTGSGKTTIFDAMAYALYGEVPGVREKGDIRSQHAPDAVECSVVFRFEVDGIVFRVERTPEQYKARQRGTGDPVKVVAKARLVRESDDTPLESRVTTVTAACIDLIGLKADQFERVVLLPQGRFQQFLLADTAERLPLLRQLFGTGKWLDVVDDLKARSRDASAAVESIEKELDKRRFAIGGDLDAAAKLLDEGVHAVPVPDTSGGGIDLADDTDDTDRDSDSDDVVPETDAESLDAFAGRLARLDARALARRAAVDSLVVRAGAAEAALATVNGLITNWDRRRLVLEERVALDDAEPAIGVVRAEYEMASAAVPVLRDAETADRDVAVVIAATTAREASVAALGTAIAHADLGDECDPDEAMNRVIAARAVLSGRRDALGRLAEVASERTDLEVRRTALVGERAERFERATSIATEVEQATARLVTFDALAASEPQRRVLLVEAATKLDQRTELDQILSAVPVALEAQAAATERQREAMRRFDEAAAPRLAESLVEGEACPVCGSTEHPAPVSTSDALPVDSAERDAAGAAAVHAVVELQRLADRRDVLEVALGDAVSQTAEEIGSNRDARGVEHEAATVAAEDAGRLRTLVDGMTVEHGEILARVGVVDLDLAGIDPMVENAISRVAEASTVLGGLAEQWADDPDSVGRALNAEASALDAVETLVATCRARATTVAEASARALASSQALTDTLNGSAFLAVADARAVARTREQLATMEGLLRAHDARRAANDTLSEEISTLDLPDERPDATDMAFAADSARAEAAFASDASSIITDRLEQARTDLTAARGIEGDSAVAVERSRMLQVLARTCDGQGPRRISLETWVLAGELDRVASAANHHLGRMTSGRYRIERTDDAGHGGRQAGLDLRVLDAHTGRARRPGSLSGGEQFQASLALALGLADVIGHGGAASGRTFEALFVDEGFGSLDPESLGQAVDALHQINATGRTIGVITHVEAMKDDLPTGIRVDRLGDGEGSTLVVRPGA